MGGGGGGFGQFCRDGLIYGPGSYIIFFGYVVGLVDLMNYVKWDGIVEMPRPK